MAKQHTYIKLSGHQRKAVLEALVHEFEVNASAYADNKEIMRQTRLIGNTMSELAKTSHEKKIVKKLINSYSKEVYGV